MHHINIVLSDIITFCHDILAIPTHGMEFAILNAHIQLNLVMHHSLSDVHRERRSAPLNIFMDIITTVTTKETV